MTETDVTTPKADFSLRWSVDRKELEGARWWNETLEGLGTSLQKQKTRRAFIKASLIAGGAALAISAWLLFDDDDAPESDLQITEHDALELQRAQGWSVGSTARLSFTNVADTNVDGEPFNRISLALLVDTMRPSVAAHEPFYVPTLFQALQGVRGASLADQIVPEREDPAEHIFERALGLADQFRTKDAPRDVAIVLDLPGPDSVTAAAALASVFDPIFQFDNWPHPAGVVPSHRVLASLLYELPRFHRALEVRNAAHLDGARPPPMFVLDENRLHEYGDAADVFDNRYTARMPSAEALRGLGVTRVLYVQRNAAPHERDDLNADFVAYEAAGIAVRKVALSDFRDTDTPDNGPYLYGGHTSTHTWFFTSHGWQHGVPVASPSPARLTSSPVSPGQVYRPVARPTLFSSNVVGGLAGVGKQKPSTFGRVSVRSFPGGAVDAVGRSGTLARTRSTGFG